MGAFALETKKNAKLSRVGNTLSATFLGVKLEDKNSFERVFGFTNGCWGTSTGCGKWWGAITGKKLYGYEPDAGCIGHGITFKSIWWGLCAMNGAGTNWNIWAPLGIQGCDGFKQAERGGRNGIGSVCTWASFNNNTKRVVSTTCLRVPKLFQYLWHIFHCSWEYYCLFTWMLPVYFDKFKSPAPICRERVLIFSRASVSAIPPTCAPQHDLILSCLLPLRSFKDHHPLGSLEQPLQSNNVTQKMSERGRRSSSSNISKRDESIRRRSCIRLHCSSL